MSNSRKRRRALARMRARDEGTNRPIAMNAVNLLGAILGELNQTGPANHTSNGSTRDDSRENHGPEPAPEPNPRADAESPETESRKQAFRAIVAEFTAELRARCLAQTGQEDQYTSRGQTYRWKPVQDETPKKVIYYTYRLTEEGDFIRSMAVQMNAQGIVVNGPNLFRAVSDALLTERVRRSAATEPPCAVPDVRPSMAFRDYQLIAMRNACSYMGQNLLWLGESPDGSRIKLLAECVDMIDAGLAAIGR
jgi:hypothetical protein